MKITLSQGEAAAVESALWDYRIETERYLSGISSTNDGHSPCCATAKVRRDMQAEAKVSLEGRLATINSVLKKVARDE